MDELTPSLKAMGNPDELLKSEDDGELFIIRWKADFREDQVIAHERTGTNGMKWAIVGRQVRQLSDAELRQLIAEKE